MKRNIALICVLLSLLLFPIRCMADSTTSIDALGFSLSLPSDLYVFTQDTSESSTAWKAFDLNPSVFIEFLKDNNIYLDAVAADVSYEIVIIGRERQSYKELFNLNLYEDEQILDLLGSSDSSAAESLGLTFESESIYKVGDIKYISSLGTQKTDGQIVWIKSYMSVVNGKYFQIMLRSYTGALSSQQEKLIKEVVDSVHFKEILSKPSNSSSTSSGGNVLYKAVIGGISALIIGIPAALFNASKKKHNKEEKEIPFDAPKKQVKESPSVVQSPAIPQNEGKDGLKKVVEKANSQSLNVSYADEIRKYKKLCDDGIITREEFDAKKKQLLGL